MQYDFDLETESVSPTRVLELCRPEYRTHYDSEIEAMYAMEDAAKRKVELTQMDLSIQIGKRKRITARLRRMTKK